MKITSSEKNSKWVKGEEKSSPFIFLNQKEKINTKWYNDRKKGLLKMSVQSDCIWLFYMCAYSYAHKHGLKVDDVLKQFYDFQIMERILVQYEYLHQVDYSYVEDYIEECMNMKSNEIVLFHGTIEDFKEIDLAKSRNKRDFGMGFYTTVLEKQAHSWAKSLANRYSLKEYYVKSYVFHKNDGLKIKKFSEFNEEWLDMVSKNRMNGGIQHDYDVVIGPVADDNTMSTIQRYMDGAITSDEAIKKLKYAKMSNQVSFHTEKAIETLYKWENKKYDIE